MSLGSFLMGQGARPGSLANVLFGAKSTREVELEQRAKFEKQQRAQMREEQLAASTEAFQSFLGAPPLAPFDQQTTRGQAETLAMLENAGPAALATAQGQLAPLAPLTPMQQLDMQAKELQIANAEAANARAQELHPFAVAEARFKRDKVQMEVAAMQGQLPERVTIQTMQPGSGQLTPRTVDTPTSTAYQDDVIRLGKIMRGRNKLSELTELVGDVGTEFVGPTATRMEALVADATLAYAEAKGMGALQAPDLELAQKVIKDPTKLSENLSAVLRSTLGAPAAIKGVLTGEGGGFLGLSRQDQIAGIQQAYRVAKDDMDSNIVAVLLRNPLLLDGISDADLATIAPDIAEPLYPYLRALNRWPWPR